MSNIIELLINNCPKKSIIGFDGFVDEIIHVVDKRIDTKNFTRIETIEEYGKKILNAKGLSCNFEFVTVQTKLGGNGPILANALINLGEKVEYIGALGNPINRVFENIEKNAVAHSISNNAHTDAVEFNDGKIIISKLESFSDITYGNIIDKIGKEKLIELFDSADLLGFENWTMIPNMSGIIDSFLKEIAPKIKGEKIIFFDLADPQKRLKEDIAYMLNLVKESNKFFKSVLGLNLKEAKQIAEVLGAKEELNLRELCTYIGKKLDTYALVIHPTDRACAYHNGEYVEVRGPYCAEPKLTTGAGDNFNAGLCFGLLQGGTIEDALRIGVSTSGFYVRNARSPSKSELIEFINTI